MSLVISKKPFTEYGTQPYGPNISANLVCTIGQLYDKATSQVQMKGSIREWFRTTVGVRHGCLLSPTLFNIFLEQIMSDALEDGWLVGWLVGCFGLNDPLRNISVYIRLSPRKREKEKRSDR